MTRIQRGLELLLVLAFFLPVTFSAIFRGNIEGFGDVTLRWGLPLSFLILSFLFFEISRDEVGIWIEKSVWYLVILNIFCYAAFLLILGLVSDGTIQQPVLFVYQTTLMLLYIIPALILLIITGVIGKRMFATAE